MAFHSRRNLIKADFAPAATGGVGYSLWPQMDAYRDKVARQRAQLSDNPGLVELLWMATLAANSHNTQPWKSRLGDVQVRILPDPARRTTVVDPDDHHLYVSLGCAAENLAIASAALGHCSEVAVFAMAAPHIDISLATATPGDQTPFRAIPDDIALLQRAARQKGVLVRFLEGAAKRDGILDYGAGGIRGPA